MSTASVAATIAWSAAAERGRPGLRPGGVVSHRVRHAASASGAVWRSVTSSLARAGRNTSAISAPARATPRRDDDRGVHAAHERLLRGRDEPAAAAVRGHGHRAAQRVARGVRRAAGRPETAASMSAR